MACTCAARSTCVLPIRGGYYSPRGAAGKRVLPNQTITCRFSYSTLEMRFMNVCGLMSRSSRNLYRLTLNCSFWDLRAKRAQP